MGLYNIVKAELTCPHCGHVSELDVQFKYGRLDLREYQLGEVIEWGGDVRPYKYTRAERALLDPKTFRGTREGEPGHRRVVLYGYGENCPQCGGEGPECGVWLENDRIVAVRLVSDEELSEFYDSFKVLEE